LPHQVVGNDDAALLVRRTNSHRDLPQHRRQPRLTRLRGLRGVPTDACRRQIGGDAGQQLARRERLDQIVIRSRL
jgi:hypothetical protein